MLDFLKKSFGYCIYLCTLKQVYILFVFVLCTGNHFVSNFCVLLFFKHYIELYAPRGKCATSSVVIVVIVVVIVMIIIIIIIALISVCCPGSCYSQTFAAVPKPAFDPSPSWRPQGQF